jgi:threonine dehydrogenase-like Zn-dependent dehydrogenase
VIPREATVAVLVEPRRVELRQETLAVCGPTDLLCETLVTAISPGTELAAYSGLQPLRDGIAFPRLLGYCNVGRVLAVGSAARNIKVGDRILSFTSHRSHFVLSETDVLLRLPESAKSEEVACAYLFHLGYNAVLRSDVRAGSRVFVLGLGALGLASVAIASLAGAIVFGLSDQERSTQIAHSLGASAVYSRAKVNDFLARPDGGLADVVIVTTNAWADWEVALRVAAMRGTVAVLGFPGRGQPPPGSNPLDSRYFYAKQLRIEAVGISSERPDDRGFNRFNERENLAFLVDRIMLGRLDAKALVSGEYPGTEIRRAYEDLLARTKSPVTYILRWTQE